MKVTVLIATCGRSEGLRHTVGSLFNTADLRLTDWEVVFVSSGVS